MSARVLVLGLSGGSLDLLSKLSAKGWLPNIDFLFRRGTTGVLDSPLPPLPSPEWAALLSGKNPAHTGLFDQENKVVGSYFPRQIAFSTERIFSSTALGNLGNLRTAIVNVPLKTDMRLINGTVIDRDHLFHEKSLIELDLFSLFSKVEPDEWEPEPSEHETRDHMSRLERGVDATIYQGNVLRNLIKSDTWDLVLSHFTLLDRILSRYWNQIESILIKGPQNAFEEMLLSALKILDDIVGQMLCNLAPNGMLIVFSGHGYGPLKHSFSINRFLEGLGHLSVRRGKESERLVNRFVTPLLRKAGLRRHHLKKILERLSLGDLAESIALPFSEDLGVFNWKKSRAFSLSHFGIHINLKGREMHGTVSPGREYRSVGDEIIENLVNVRDPETGERTFTDVRWKDDIYNGPNLECLPDIIVNHWNGGLSFMDYDRFRHQRSVFSTVPDKTGACRKNGFFLMNGPCIPRGALLENPFSIFDIAPTSLSHLHIRTPRDLEGHPFPTLDPELSKPVATHTLSRNG